MKAVEQAVDWYHERLLSAPDAAVARKYLRERGLSGDEVRAFRIGWAPDEWQALVRALKLPDDVVRDTGLGYLNRNDRQTDAFRGRILFPIFDANGDAVGFGGRVMPGAEGPKYKNTPETLLYQKSKLLYALNWSKARIVTDDRAIVCEGYTDVIGFARAGLPAAVATCGTALTTDHVKLLRRYARKLVLAFDADSAGQAAAERFYQWEKEHDLEVTVADLPAGRRPGRPGRLRSGAPGRVGGGGGAVPQVPGRPRAVGRRPRHRRGPSAGRRGRRRRDPRAPERPRARPVRDGGGRRHPRRARAAPRDAAPAAASARGARARPRRAAARGARGASARRRGARRSRARGAAPRRARLGRRSSRGSATRSCSAATCTPRRSASSWRTPPCRRPSTRPTRAWPTCIGRLATEELQTTTRSTRSCGCSPSGRAARSPSSRSRRSGDDAVALLEQVTWLKLVGERLQDPDTAAEAADELVAFVGQQGEEGA